MVQVDPCQLIQVLVNLIFNALESMRCSPPAKSRLVIVTGRNSADQVEIAIRDNGLVIADEITAIMTAPFLSTEYSSIRMELPVIRTAIEGHGEPLWATPNRHQGVTMRLALPCFSI
ncbi:hypothetical protein CCP3SC1_880005 [Gammaproteobacteria bacterium]